MGWTTSNFRPTGGRVLVRVDDRVSHFGAIEIPDEWRRYPQTGVVIRAGRDTGVAVGERVVFGKWNGVALPDPDDDHAGWGEGRYRVMESASQKMACDRSLKFAVDDIYGVIDEAPAVIDEFGAPQLRKPQGAA